MDFDYGRYYKSPKGNEIQMDIPGIGFWEEIPGDLYVNANPHRRV